MFERGLNLRKLIPTALKNTGGRSLIYLCLTVLVLSYGISRSTPSTPVSETPLAGGTASTVTTSLSSRRGEPLSLAVPESLFKLGRVFVIAGKSSDNDLALRTAAWNHGQLEAGEPTYVLPLHKMMREYTLAGQLRLSRRIEVRARMGVLAGRDIYFISYLEVIKAR
jgi:hypothetical protein